MKYLWLLLISLAFAGPGASGQTPDPNCSDKANELLERAWRAQPMNRVNNDAAPSKAEALYEQALADSPKCRRASRLLVGLLIRRERYDEASKYNERFLQLFPDDPGGLSQKASLLVRLNNDYLRALEIETKLIDVPEFNNNGNVFYQMARIYSLMKRLDESLDYLKRAVSIEKGWADKGNAQTDLDFKNLRKDKRFWVLVKDLKLRTSD